MQLPYYVKNTVVKGFGRGSKAYACPTANVDDTKHLDIPTGIYCGLVQLVISSQDQVQEEPNCRKHYDEIVQRLPYVTPVKGMVCSYGYNPLHGNKEKCLEVHILDNLEYNFYGAELRVLICHKMRDEMDFGKDQEKLKQAIANDIKQARDQVTNFEKYASNKSHFIINDINRNGLS